MSVDYQSFEQQVAAELTHRHDLGRRLRRVERMLGGKKPDPEWVLRHHEDEPIDEPEVLERDNLDFLLDGLSAMYIGGAADPEFFEEQRIPPERLLSVLENGNVSRYMEKHYPIAVPVLLREHLNRQLPPVFEKQIHHERSKGEWKSFYLRFLELDGAFVGESPFVDFMTLLDEISVKGYWLNDLRHALSNRKRLDRFMENGTGRRLLEGFQDFFEFSEGLDELLREMKEMPVHRGLFWLHFGYWYGGGGKRMQDAAEWLIEALDQLPEIDKTADTVALEALMSRLTHPLYYAGKTIDLAGHALDRWRKHALQ